MQQLNHQTVVACCRPARPVHQSYCGCQLLQAHSNSDVPTHPKSQCIALTNPAKNFVLKLTCSWGSHGSFHLTRHPRKAASWKACTQPCLHECRRATHASTANHTNLLARRLSSPPLAACCSPFWAAVPALPCPMNTYMTVKN